MTVLSAATVTALLLVVFVSLCVLVFVVLPELSELPELPEPPELFELLVSSVFSVVLGVLGGLGGKYPPPPEEPPPELLAGTAFVVRTRLLFSFVTVPLSFAVTPTRTSTFCLMAVSVSRLPPSFLMR